MEIIKKQLPAREAKGWFLYENALKKWEEDFLDEDTREVVSIERYEVIAPKGELVNEIIISLLEENGIEQVWVSNVRTTGVQNNYMQLWQVELSWFDRKEVKSRYLVPAVHPKEVEDFIRIWAEQNIIGAFSIGNIVQKDFTRALFMYDKDEEKLNKKSQSALFYKAVLKHDTDRSNILIKADKFRTAERAVTKMLIYNEDSGHRFYEVVKMELLNVSKCFLEQTAIDYYSLSEFNENYSE